MNTSSVVKVGLVDLDTSHPAAWTPILRSLGCQVAGVFDGGAVWPASYAQEFARKNDIPKVYTDLDQMAEEVDLAIIHSCNWDLHVQRAAPFIQADKAVLIDKPIAGNLRDLQQILDWSAQGRRVYGGSSLRWCIEIADYLNTPVVSRGEIHTVFAGCSVDEFNYGIHAFALLCGILGPGARSVRYLGESTQQLVQINWPDGRKGILCIGAQEGYLPFHATLVTTREARHIQVDPARLYAAFLEKVLPYLCRKMDAPPLPVVDLLEPERMALAARESRARRGVEVPIESMVSDSEGYDGRAFARSYREARLKDFTRSG